VIQLGGHSALHPAGPQAARIHDFWQFLWIVAAVVFAAVVAALLYAAFRRRGTDLDPPAAHRSAVRAVAAATVGSLVVLFVFLLLNFRAGQALTMPPDGAVHVKVRGHQWWWEVVYPAATPSDQVTTANELHVPAGRPVVVELTSADVIHSFWPPSLVGKRDLIPGDVATIWFQADTPGVYRGQCAEFCGHQHAKMGFLVIAEPPADFEGWLRRQRNSSATPADSVAARGQEVFLATQCALCHTIRPTPAGSRVGPDLTHLAGRRTIAAGSLPNDPASLARWIADPQGVKPGAFMPATPLEQADLDALVAYLGTLE
jgi:cytochrome c oxidase subunit II